MCENNILSFPKIRLDRSFSSLRMCGKCQKVSPYFTRSVQREDDGKYYVYRICSVCVSSGEEIETLVFDNVAGKFIDHRE